MELKYQPRSEDNNRMQKRTIQKPQKQKSHDLLHSLLNCREVDNFIHNLKAHKISEKYRVLQQKLHRTSKSNFFRQVSTLNRKVLRESHHLVKHQNKVEANIELHRVHKMRNNFTSQLISRKMIQPSHVKQQSDSFFIPKTREEILTRHGKWRNQNRIIINHSPKESDNSIKIATDTLPASSTPTKIKWRYNTHGSIHLETNKENHTKQNTLHQAEISSFATKNNSFSTLSRCQSRIFGKEKQDSISQDHQNTEKPNKISGFTRHELFSYYRSLITFSLNNEDKYIAGFETMLNLMNITSNETTIRQFMTTFMNNPTFPQFIGVFERVVESSMKETVVDYFQIVLDGKWSRQLCFDELIQLLSDRMSTYHAKEIVEQVFYQLEKTKEQKVSVQQIVGLCYKSEEFCSFMKGYSQQMQRKRISQKPKKKIRHD